MVRSVELSMSLLLLPSTNSDSQVTSKRAGMKYNCIPDKSKRNAQQIQIDQEYK